MNTPGADCADHAKEQTPRIPHTLICCAQWDAEARALYDKYVGVLLRQLTQSVLTEGNRDNAKGDKEQESGHSDPVE